MVTLDNYEEYMVQYTDGELQPAEAQQLMAFLDQNPHLKEDLALFEATILTPDTKQVFANKEALLKEEHAARTIAFPMWQRYSIAAGVAAILFVSFFTLWNKSAQQATEVAQVQTPNTGATSQVQAPKATAVESVTSASQADQTIKAAPSPKALPAQQKVMPLAASEKKVNRVTKEPQQEPTVAINTPKEYMEKIEGAPVTTFATETRQMPIAAIATPAVKLPTIDEENETKSFLDNLPLEDIKKEGVTDMINVVAATYKKVNNIKHAITDEKNITVRVEKKQLILSF